MANSYYPKFVENLLRDELTGSIVGLNLKLVLLTSGYTYSNAHEFLSDIAGGNRVATSGNLANITVTVTGDNVVLDADDVTFSALTGSAVVAGVVYVDTGVEGTSPLIAFSDAISITPDGNDVDIAIASITTFQPPA